MSSADTAVSSSSESSSGSSLYSTSSASSTETSEGEVMGEANWEIAQEFQLLGVNDVDAA